MNSPYGLIEQFTRHRLELMTGDDIFPVATIGEVRNLAQIALAVMDAEVTGWCLHGFAPAFTADKSKADYWISRGWDVTPLYTTPPVANAPNYPEIPDSWKLVPTELTRGMQNAWDTAPNCNGDDEDENMRNAYRSMIASAPLLAGWKLVPMEATPDMLDAAWNLHAIHHPSAYRTMIAAAPAPEGDRETTPYADG